MKKEFVFVLVVLFLAGFVLAQEKSPEVDDEYQINTITKVRLLGIIPLEEKSIVTVDGSNGEIVNVNRPFWAFLAIDLTQADISIEELIENMLNSYYAINTLQFHFEQFGLSEDGTVTSSITTDDYIDKLNNRVKKDFSGTDLGGKVANIWVNDDYYDERTDIVYHFSCPSNVLEKNFADELIAILTKWPSLELVGIENINGRDAYKIGDDDTSHYLWIDQENYFPVRELFEGNFEKAYSDYIINEEISDDVFSPTEGKVISEQGCDDEESVSDFGE